MDFKCIITARGECYLELAVGNWILTYNTIPLRTGRQLSPDGNYMDYCYNGSTTLDLSHTVYKNKTDIVEDYYLSIDFLFDNYRQRPEIRVHSSMGVRLLS